MKLHEALRQLHDEHSVIILDRHLSIWPGADPKIRRVIMRHSSTVRQLIEESDILVCPSPGRHRKSWRYAGAGRYICEICESLSKHI